MHGTCVPCCILVADDLSATGMPIYNARYKKKNWLTIATASHGSGSNFK